MSNQSEPAIPDHLGSWLAAYCDAAAVETHGSESDADTPDDPFLPRLERAAKCLWLLEHVWPHETLPIATDLGYYRIVRKLGQGGMGAVYEAVHTLLKRPVALKVLRANHLHDAQAVHRFHCEMEAVGKLDHPNIVRATDAGNVDGTHFLVMELVDGIDLGKLLDWHGPLAAPDACEICRQVAVALDHVHQHGLVHRDVKPSNLILDRSGRIKLLDLGLARLVPESADRQQIIQRYKLIGTLDYMAPEQAAEPSSVDIRADLYGLGCVLSKLLTGAGNRDKDLIQATGRRATGACSPGPVACSRAMPVGRPVLPPIATAVQSVMSRLLAPSPSDRFGTPAEVIDALGPLTQGNDLLALAQEACNRLVRKRENGLQATGRRATGACSPEPVACSPQRSTDRGSAFAASTAKTSTRRWRRRAVLTTVCVVVSAAFALPYSPLTLPSPSGRGVAVRVAGTASDRDAFTADDLDRSEAGTLGTWNLPPSGDPMPGLIPHPATLPGMGRWQIDTVAPRGYVNAVAWSPDGRLLAVGSSDHYIRVYDARTQRLVYVLAGHTRNIPCLAWSPDGRWLASAGGFRDWSVRLWSMEDGAPGPMIETHWGALSVTWSPDGRQLAIARRSPTDHIQVWDPFEGKLINSFTHENRRVYSVAWSPDGKWIASFGDDALRLWDAKQASPGPVFAGAEEDKSGHFTQLLAWSPDSKWLAAPGSARTIRTWNVAAEEEGPLLEGHSDGVKSVAWSPDGEHVASGGFDATIRIWDAATGEQERVLKHAWWVACVVWSPDGRQLASGSRNGTVRGWDFDSGKQLWEIGSKWPTTPSTSWACVDWSPDGRTLATGGADATVRLWDVDHAAELRVLGGHDAAVNWVRWGPRSQRLASATYGPYGTIRLWDANTGMVQQTLEDSVTGAPQWSPDGRAIAVPGYRNVQLYDTAEGTLVRGLRGHTDHVLCVAWSPDGKWLASGSDDDTVRCWSATDGRVMSVLKGHGEPVGWLDWSSTSDGFASVGMTQGKGGSLRRWNQAGSSTLPGGAFEIEKWFPTAAWSPDGTLLATGHDNGDLWIRDANDGTPTLLLAGHAESLRGLTWSPNATRVASVSDDYTIRIWKAANGAPHWLALLLPNGEAAVFAPDGELLNPSPTIDRQIVYLFEEPTGALRLVPGSDFDATLGKQPMRQSPSRPMPPLVSGLLNQDE